MKNITFIIAVLALLASYAFAPTTGTITGTITSKSTGKPLAGVNVTVDNTSFGDATDGRGHYTIKNVPSGRYSLTVSMLGFISETAQNVIVNASKTTTVDFDLTETSPASEEVIIKTEQPVMDQDKSMLQRIKQKLSGEKKMDAVMGMSEVRMLAAPAPCVADFNTEEYRTITENEFFETMKKPLSTFSIDVDAASYSNTRRFLTQGQLPPKDAVRIEEFINYFDYDYPEPKANDPFSIYLEYSACPWNEQHNIVHIGLKGRSIQKDKQLKNNLVFLLDVSGSMNSPDKLPLLKKAFRLLVNELNPNDMISIVVYAGAAGLVLEPTPGSDKENILAAIDNLNAGGSTAGGAGIQLAYKTAKENLLKEGNNRIILATDGDFNIGVSSTSELTRLVEDKRKEGIFLTILGFGMGNIKDNRLEQLADKGNGNYAYIDNIMEAKKVLVNEIGATLFTIAKDVKIQVEFNPAKIKSYRLVGYENRLLTDKDFEDDTKDAGEIGAGHTVTALYEVVPADNQPEDYKLKYQETKVNKNATSSDEALTVRIRYKQPDGSTSTEIVNVVKDKPLALSKTSDNYRFSVAVAEFGMILRDSQFKGNANMKNVTQLAKASLAKDEFGYRAEFVRLVDTAELLMKQQ
ncbi:von Willebrand factor type A domain-containing protein [candidate division KSB1 bacterium]|nr:von Willebrand factor type A domain-containing protein [candidate division KSB1 bacterium]